MVRADRPGDIPQTLAEGTSTGSSVTKVRLIDIPDTLSVKQLADLLQVSPVDIIKRLMRNGIMANINQTIDYAAAAAVIVSFLFWYNMTMLH